MDSFPKPEFVYKNRLRSLLYDYNVQPQLLKEIISIIGEAVDENIEYLRLPYRKYVRITEEMKPEERDLADAFNRISMEVNTWSERTNKLIDVLKWK